MAGDGDDDETLETALRSNPVAIFRTRERERDKQKNGARIGGFWMKTENREGQNVENGYVER